jgi:hypothetical protein
MFPHTSGRSQIKDVKNRVLRKLSGPEKDEMKEG